MVLKTVSVSLVVDSCISTSTNQHHSIGRVGRMVGTGRRNSRTGGIREPEEMGLEGESWSKSWLWVGKGVESGKGLSWIHFSFN